MVKYREILRQKPMGICIGNVRFVAHFQKRIASR